MRIRDLALHWQILIAILLAGVAGGVFGEEGQLLGVRAYDVFDFVGELFLRALTMLIVPLIASSIISGVVGLGGDEGLGRLGARTLGFYALSSLLAILLGLLLVNLFAPGIDGNGPVGEQLGLPAGTAAVMQSIEGRGAAEVIDIFKRMVPSNIVAEAAEGRMLGLITFSMLFGFFMSRIPMEQGQTLRWFWEAVFQTMMQMTMFVMRFAPIGVFGLVAKTVAATGFASFWPMLSFFLTVLVALLVHSFGTLLVMLHLAGIRPIAHLRAMFPALLTAFSTASSSATLPLTMECVEKKSGVSNRVSSFVLPLGATVNMDGTALYECVAAMFIAQAYGLDLGFAQQFTVVLIALLTSIGVAGIPAASLVAISIILGAVGLPLDGIGLILVTDRILDMCRTAVNVFSDSCGAVIIARSVGEETSVARRAR